MSQKANQTASQVVTAEAPKINTRELRDAFGAFMTGVTIVTTASDDGKPLGFTANSFSSVSLDPALLLVSIAKTSSNYQTFSTAGHFAINILAEGQKDLSNTFARPSDDRFANVNWHLSANRNPLIDDVTTICEPSPCSSMCGKHTATLL